MDRLRAGILGATGVVGQRLVSLLHQHPFFTVAGLCSSRGKKGKRYGEVVRWVLEEELPEEIARMELLSVDDQEDVELYFSALPAEVAADLEWKLAKKGRAVISNASYHRMNPLVPLIIPEVNPGHLMVLPVQQREYGFGSGILVTNPNCATIGLVLAILPVWQVLGVEKVQVVTMQSISGAGYPGVSALDILSGIIPYIKGEEEKLSQEPLKILGNYSKKGIRLDQSLQVAAQCNRVPVREGHLLSIEVQTREKAHLQEIQELYRNFSVDSHIRNLPSSPEKPLFYQENGFHLNSALQRGKGMTVTVSRIEPSCFFTFRMIALVHNTIRGAAGAALLNGELLYQLGFLG